MARAATAINAMLRRAPMPHRLFHERARSRVELILCSANRLLRSGRCYGGCLSITEKQSCRTRLKSDSFA
jgi:hypothetical protein